MKTSVYCQMEQDVLKLKESMEILNELVNDQQPSLNLIEDEIQQTRATVTHATVELESIKIYYPYLIAAVSVFVYFLL